ncbi:hypothetical protein [Phyllobacterium sp. YR531]|uniref:hypothetical protein n=1 Tax=Phyllobacterium sp. YR531 TaxID=1144343 RepID=UPI00026F5276|nr:hypothetical protein [Phyllobacterium sp. YR531]EJN04431.1 hypothetical protein PMI41_02071 [Phyllobacterium sp. YR531]
MSKKQSISSAPTDGSKVQIFWTDEDGQENQSIGQYRSLDRLKATGGQWDETDAGWWIFTDSNTQKKVTPTGWQPAGKSEDSEEAEEE